MVGRNRLHNNWDINYLGRKVQTNPSIISKSCHVLKERKEIHYVVCNYTYLQKGGGKKDLHGLKRLLFFIVQIKMHCITSEI